MQYQVVKSNYRAQLLRLLHTYTERSLRFIVFLGQFLKKIAFALHTMSDLRPILSSFLPQKLVHGPKRNWNQKDFKKFL